MSGVRSAKLFAEFFKYTVAGDADGIREALRAACEIGNFEVAKWLKVTFSLTADDARADDNFALRWACRKGQLEVAKWLKVTFSLTADDARAGNNQALRWACRKGHLEVAKWLKVIFSLTADGRWAPPNLRQLN